jgi:hypothetical protein
VNGELSERIRNQSQEVKSLQKEVRELREEVADFIRELLHRFSPVAAETTSMEPEEKL